MQDNIQKKNNDKKSAVETAQRSIMETILSMNLNFRERIVSMNN